MANPFTQDYKSVLDFNFMLYDKFLKICPENIWHMTFGGWPVSRQFYHSLEALSMLTASIVKDTQIANPAPHMGDLGRQFEEQPSKEQAQEFLNSLKQALDALVGSLNDETLLIKNELLSQRTGRPMTVATTLEMMACHMQYHLGACDAALRQNGLEGTY